jgi:hypothetical protein
MSILGVQVLFVVFCFDRRLALIPRSIAWHSKDRGSVHSTVMQSFSSKHVLLSAAYAVLTRRCGMEGVMEYTFSQFEQRAPSSELGCVSAVQHTTDPLMPSRPGVCWTTRVKLIWQGTPSVDCQSGASSCFGKDSIPFPEATQHPY